MKIIKSKRGLYKDLDIFVDDKDFDELNKFNWNIQKAKNTYYARRHVKESNNKFVYMHTSIMNTPKNMMCDHFDGNGLNNQRDNLRIVTRRQNCQNLHINKSSIYPGVSFDKRINKWTSQIRINNKPTYIGIFELEIDAFNAYVKSLKNIGETLIEL